MTYMIRKKCNISEMFSFSFRTTFFIALSSAFVLLAITLRRDPEFVCEKLEPLSPKFLKHCFYFCSSHESTYAMVKPDAVSSGKFQLINSAINEHHDLYVSRHKKVWLTESAVKELYLEHSSRPFYRELIEYLTSGPVIIMELRGNKAISVWRKLIGPTDPILAKTSSPSCLRARIGQSKTINSLHGSDSLESASRELELLFSPASHERMYSLPSKSFNYTILLVPSTSEKIQAEIKTKFSYQGFKILKEKALTATPELLTKVTDLLNSTEFNNRKESSDNTMWVVLLSSEDALERLTEIIDIDSFKNNRKANTLSLSAIYGKNLFSPRNQDEFTTLSKLLFTQEELELIN